MSLKMTVAFSGNSRVQPLVDGRIRPENIDLEVVTVEGGMLCFRNSQYDEFDDSETLLGGDGARWGWSGLPVFLSQGYFRLGVLVNTSSGIETLGELKGKRIGGPDYDMTAALWMRCGTKDLYGIDASDNVWYNGRTKEFSHGGLLGLGEDGPPGVTHQWLSPDQYLDQMLDSGELDAAVFSPGTGLTSGHTVSMDRYGGTPLTGNYRIRPLLDDRRRAVVADFYRKTVAFMANHHVIVQNRMLKDDPWAARALFKAFRESKVMAYQDARRQRATYLYFQGKDEQDHAAAFGENPYPLGLKAMRPPVDRAMQGSLEQGLIRKPMRPENIYQPSTLDTQRPNHRGGFQC